MKLKFVWILLSISFVLLTSTNATCTKEQVFKLLDKKFSKKEINSVCGIETKMHFFEKKKWLNPSAVVCTKYGGKIDHNTCRANWKQANAICSDMYARLPSFYELKHIIQICDGVVDSNTYNRRKKSYQACYKEYGFLDASFNDYWSSNTRINHEKRAWIVSYIYGFTYSGDKRNSFYVRCAR